MPLEVRLVGRALELGALLEMVSGRILGRTLREPQRSPEQESLIQSGPLLRGP
jgi:hypothetical protein